jgi:F-type H+-transporting ATPase subunit epsilon
MAHQGEMGQILQPATIPPFEVPMANTLRCSVVTPSSVAFDAEATYISFQAFDGQKGVMPGASPFLTRLGTGTLTVNGAKSSTTMVVDGGFAQMQGDTLTLLADSATAAESIDGKSAAAELQQANAKAVSGAGTKPADREAVERAQALAHAKVAASRGRKN